MENLGRLPSRIGARRSDWPNEVFVATATKGLVQSLDRVMTVLSVIAESPGGLRLGEIAGVTGLAPSTFHRLLATMERRRFVQFDPRCSVWLIGREAFRVGSAFVRHAAFVAPAMPVMRRLRDETRETVNIGSPDDGCIVILAQVESREVIRAINIVGGRSPLSSSGLGKAILSTWDKDALDSHLSRHGLSRSTALQHHRCCNDRRRTRRDAIARIRDRSGGAFHWLALCRRADLRPGRGVSRVRRGGHGLGYQPCRHRRRQRQRHGVTPGALRRPGFRCASDRLRDSLVFAGWKQAAAMRAPADRQIQVE